MSLILLTLPVGTATVERSFSQLKLVKMRLRSRISDSNLAKLMRIAIEVPDLTTVDFNEIIDGLATLHSFTFYNTHPCSLYFHQFFLGGGGIPGCPPPFLYETLLVLRAPQFALGVSSNQPNPPNISWYLCSRRSIRVYAREFNLICSRQICTQHKDHKR